MRRADHRGSSPVVENANPTPEAFRMGRMIFVVDGMDELRGLQKAGVYSAAVPSRQPTTGDRELVLACRRGDEHAWEALVNKYRHLVYSIPHRSGLRPDEVADVFQAVFLALLRHLDDLKREESLVAWLVVTARRESWKLARAAARQGWQLEEVREAVGGRTRTTDEEMQQLERQVAVREALARLDSRCRRLLEIFFYSDPPLSYREVSREMKISIPSIGPTRMRCLEKIKRDLKKSGLF
jgi:RNA polymerase sigma factor (sigma-70 family)